MVAIITAIMVMPAGTAPTRAIIAGGQGAESKHEPRRRKALFPGSHNPLLFNLRNSRDRHGNATKERTECSEIEAARASLSGR
jgi:hypothetical protein